MTLDIVALRADTPGVNNRIHLNNAGASLMPRPVMEALVEHLNLESNIGGYEAFHEKEAEIERLYHSCSRILNCHSTEIAFIENATRAWDMAFYSIPFQPGDRVLTSIAEYASNYIAYLQMKKKSGIEIDVVPNDEFGQIDIAKLSAMIDERVRLISITQSRPTAG